MNKKNLLAATIAVILSTGFVAAAINPVLASTEAANSATSSTQSTQSKPDDKVSQDLIKVSQDALISVRDVHNARAALFNGESARARTFVDAALTRMNAAVDEAAQYAIDIKAEQADDQYVPFDATLAVLDTYLPSDAKAEHVEKAGQQLSEGDQKAALETLKLGDVNVALSTELVPVKFAQQHIGEASKLINDGKFYEANLALKAVDDSMIVHTFAIDASPKPAAVVPDAEH